MNCILSLFMSMILTVGSFSALGKNSLVLPKQQKMYLLKNLINKNATSTTDSSKSHMRDLLQRSPVLAVFSEHVAIETGDPATEEEPVLKFQILRAMEESNSLVDNDEFRGAIHRLFSLFNNMNVQLILNSPGGDVDRKEAIIDAMDEISPEKLSVHLPRGAYCASACAMIFLYGGNRTCEPGSKIGLHSVHVFGTPIPSQAARSLTMLLERPGSQAPKEWLVEQNRKGVFSRYESTDYSCETLEAAGIANLDRTYSKPVSSTEAAESLD